MKQQNVLMVAICGIFFAAIIFFSCSKSGNDSGTPGGGTPTGSDSALVNLGTNIIIPSYQQLAANTSSLDAAVTAFNAAPTAAALATVQAAFKSAYTSWAGCSEFEFGPASNLFLTTHFINSFPTDTTVVNKNIAGATYAIDGLSNYPAQGFPAIDYLLFANGDTATLARFTSSATAAGARIYLAAVSASLKNKAAAVVTAWSSSGGNYLATFIKATGTDAGSSLSLLINASVQDFDVNLQNFKIGIPIGVYGPTTLPKSPTKVEAYYSGYSKELLVAQIAAFQNIYLGNSGIGLDDKVAATSVQNNGLPLNDVIKNQLVTLTASMNALPDPLSTGIEDNDAVVDEAFTEIRKMTVLLKVDMSSALGIKISFQDDDGD